MALAGELALDGSTRPVAGALAIAEAAREGGAEAVVVPAENGPEAALAEGIEVIAARQPRPAAGAGRRRVGSRSARSRCRCGSRPPPGAPDLADLRGQPHLRHALEVAAAGGHSLLMIGPPGAGKSLAACRLPSILPPLAAGRGARGRAHRQRLRAAGRRACRRAAVSRPAPHDQPRRADRRRHPAAAGGGDPGPPRRPLPRRALRVPPRRAGGAAGAAGGRRGLDRPGRRRVAACPAASCSSPPPTRAPAGAAKPTPSAAARRVAVQRYQGRLSGALADRIDILAAVRQPSAAEIGGGAGRALGRGAGAGRRRARAPGAAPRARALQRRDDPGRGARVRARGPRPRRCSPSSTRASASAAAPTTGRCGWPRPSPTSPAPTRSATTRWRRRCSCGGGTVAEPARLPGLPAPLLAARAARPLHRADRDRRAGLALAGTAAALQRGPGRGRGAEGRRPAARPRRGDRRARLEEELAAARVLGLLPARRRSTRRRCATPPTPPGR